MRRYRGMSLLEIMLAVAVGAAILLGAVHFYSQAKNHSTALRAVAQVGRLIRANDEWRAAQRESDSEGSSANRVPEFIAAGLLEADDERNPWGGSVSVSGDNGGGQLIVRLESIPAWGCRLLVSRFKTQTTEENFACYGKGDEETWEGHFE